MKYINDLFDRAQEDWGSLIELILLATALGAVMALPLIFVL